MNLFDFTTPSAKRLIQTLSISISSFYDSYNTYSTKKGIDASSIEFRNLFELADI